jgi:hypothetical protein
MKLHEIMNEWEQDMVIDSNNLDTEAVRTPNLHAKYIKLFVAYRIKHNEYNDKYSLLRRDKFRYYRGEMTKQELDNYNWQQWQGVKPLKSEMDEFLEGDVDLVKIKSQIDNAKITIECIESILNQIKARDWQIKNAIEYKKFLTGM